MYICIQLLYLQIPYCNDPLLAIFRSLSKNLTCSYNRSITIYVFIYLSTSDGTFSMHALTVQLATTISSLITSQNLHTYVIALTSDGLTLCIL